MPRLAKSKPYGNIGKVRIRKVPAGTSGNIKGQINNRIRRKVRTFGYGR